MDGLGADPDPSAGGETVVSFLGTAGVGKSSLINALLAVQAVQAGGEGGPVTAAPVHLRYGCRSGFAATYRPPSFLWRMTHALCRLVEPVCPGVSTRLLARMRPEVRAELEREETGVWSAPAGVSPGVHAWAERVARRLIFGRPWGVESPAQLLSGLHRILGLPEPLPVGFGLQELARMAHIRSLIPYMEEARPYQVQEGAPDFDAEYAAHQCGHLAPLVMVLTRQLPAPLLKSGLVIVDQPGLGIAEDDAGRSFPTTLPSGRGQAAVLVMDHRGVPDALSGALRTSPLGRLFDATDAANRPDIPLSLVVTRVDDLVHEEYARRRDLGEVVPSKRAVFRAHVERLKPLLRETLFRQLTHHHAADLTRDGTTVRRRLRRSVDVHVVSAPEFGRVHRADARDRPFLELEDTGVPGLAAWLAGISCHGPESPT